MTIEKRTLEWVVKNMGVSHEEMRSISRVASIVSARQVFCGIMRDLGFSYPSIGKFINRDHTTVVHSINRVQVSSLLSGIVKSGYEQISAKIAQDQEEMQGNYVPTELMAVSRHGSGFSKSNKTRWSKVYEKYGGKCAVCGFSAVVEVHHIVSRSMGGGDDISNLILVCPNHHSLIERGMLFIEDIHRKFEDYASIVIRDSDENK